MDRTGAIGGSWLSQKIDGSDALGDDGDYQGLITHNPIPEIRASRVAWRKMALDDQVEKMEMRKNYRNVWHTNLLSTISADTPCILFVLVILIKNFVVWVVIVDHVSHTCCANELYTMICPVACITGNDEIGDLAQMLSCLSDLVYCSVCACIQTQHKVEMDKRDGKFGPQPAMAVPSVQHMSRIDQPIPPHAGYAPQQAYGQPYGYPPPPQTHGYPPAGYPPPAYPQPHAYPPPGYSR
ncbi:hypothetical protein SADUNF_Sadunf14G0060700 [Salix dunnii]|uniref:PLAC8 family protein n=1 Tax=Salix dunnii TaxID=1413687 RepID=A0A835JHX1_9ROSI|nr:hypothetical protein SADUNF_Sadunf14G0060700 [Salix dunnii]